MNFKKTMSVVVSGMVLATAMFVGTTKDNSTNAAAAKLNVGMVTDTGGLGDKSFNDSAHNGLVKFQKKYGSKLTVLQSTKETDYMPNLGTMARNKVDITFAVGFMFENAMGKAADQYKTAKFCVVDTVIDKPNVVSVTFRENEGSFLAGVAAAKTTKTNTVGFIGGIKGSLIEKFEAGFKAGVAAVNSKIKVISIYAGSFGDSEKGKSIAIAENKQGADVIFHAAGATGLGLIAAAKEKKFWAIGVDQDQSHLAPKNVLCSMVKRVDNAVYKIAEKLKNGKFDGGKNVEYGVVDGGIGLSDKANNLSKAVNTLVSKYETAISTGKIKVPASLADLKGFKAPVIK